MSNASIPDLRPTKSRMRPLDEAQLQAARVLQASCRAIDEHLRSAQATTAAGRESYRMRLVELYGRRDAARAGLESLLREDA